MDAGSTPHVDDSTPHIDDSTLRNIKDVNYQLLYRPLEGRVTSVTTHANVAFVGLANNGCHVFRINDTDIAPLITLGKPPEVAAKGKLVKPKQAPGTTCYDIHATDEWLIYIREEDDVCAICVHSMVDVLAGAHRVHATHKIRRRAAMVIEPQLNLVILGGGAWTSSWTTDGDDAASSKSPATCESHVRVLHVPSFETRADWKATDNSVSMLRTQCNAAHSMLGVADTWTGLSVFDMRRPTDDGRYECLYKVPVEEIRNFELVDNFVAVFHKFEPNVSFWNMREQNTILCINIQDQMKELCDHTAAGEDDVIDDEVDCGVYGGDDDDDHVTSITSVRRSSDVGGDDHVLVYGTKSGCVFGMSVQSRCKLFNVPCPAAVLRDSVSTARRDVHGLRYLSDGRLVVVYERHGLAMMDFTQASPSKACGTQEK